MDKGSAELAMWELAIAIIMLVIIFAVSPIELAQATPARSYPPIIITKIDPWTPLKGLDGVKPCLAEGSAGQIDGWAFAWIELHNTTNETLTTVDDVRVEVQAMNSSGIGGNGSSESFLSRMRFGAGQSCLLPTADLISTRLGVGGGEGNGPTPGADKDGASVSIDYTLSNVSRHGGPYRHSTPALSDPYGDLAYWQLDTDNDKWIFRDDLAGKRNLNRMTLTSMAGTNHAPIVVNLTLPEEIKPPTVAQFELTFINSTAMQPINHDTTVVYEIEYRGLPVLNGNQRNGGHTSTGGDVKFLVMNQTGSLDIAVKITALNREATGGSFEYIDNPDVAEFTIVVVPEFGTTLAFIVMAVAIIVAITTTRRFKTK